MGVSTLHTTEERTTTVGYSVRSSLRVTLVCVLCVRDCRTYCGILFRPVKDCSGTKYADNLMDCLGTEYADNLVQPAGINFFKGFLLDDGWDDYTTLWKTDKTGETFHRLS